MKHPAAQLQTTQLRMPGMPARVRPGPAVSSYNVLPGQEVLYLGNVTGGPDYGARGIVRRILGRRALVDLGRSGAWHIPYCYLTLPPQAA